MHAKPNFAAKPTRRGWPESPAPCVGRGIARPGVSSWCRAQVWLAKPPNWPDLRCVGLDPRLRPWLLDWPASLSKSQPPGWPLMVTGDTRGVL